MKSPLDRRWRTAAMAAIALLGSLPGLIVVLPAIEIVLTAQIRPDPSEVTVYADGLFNPRGLAFGPDGYLYVAEAGVGGDESYDVGLPQPMALGSTGRISVIKSPGQRSTLIDGLPSGVSPFGEEVGPSGVAFIGEDLFILMAAGGGRVDRPGFRNELLRYTPGGDLIGVADITAFNVSDPTVGRQLDVGQTSAGGQPFGLLAYNGDLYVTDGNHDEVLRITPTGRIIRFFDFESVHKAPTGIAPGTDGSLYVALFGDHRISRLRPDGQGAEVIAYARHPIAVAMSEDGRMYVLEFYNRNLVEVRGLWLGVLLDDLEAPTAMIFGPDGYLYISHRGSGFREPQGQILRVRVGSPVGLLSPFRALLARVLFPIGAFLTGLIIAWAIQLAGRRSREPE